MARYIDADALLAELQEEIDFESPMYTEEQNKYLNMGLKCALRDVKAQPTADVVPRAEGEWLSTTNITISERGRRINSTWYVCSACGQSNGRRKQNFCPNCGAKMKGGE